MTYRMDWAKRIKGRAKSYFSNKNNKEFYRLKIIIQYLYTVSYYCIDTMLAFLI